MEQEMTLSVLLERLRKIDFASIGDRYTAYAEDCERREIARTLDAGIEAMRSCAADMDIDLAEGILSLCENLWSHPKEILSLCTRLEDAKALKAEVEAFFDSGAEALDGRIDAVLCAENSRARIADAERLAEDIEQTDRKILGRVRRLDDFLTALALLDGWRSAADFDEEIAKCASGEVTLDNADAILALSERAEGLSPAVWALCGLSETLLAKKQTALDLINADRMEKASALDAEINGILCAENSRARIADAERLADRIKKTDPEVLSRARRLDDFKAALSSLGDWRAAIDFDEEIAKCASGEVTLDNVNVILALSERAEKLSPAAWALCGLSETLLAKKQTALDLIDADRAEKAAALDRRARALIEAENSEERCRRIEALRKEWLVCPVAVIEKCTEGDRFTALYAALPHLTRAADLDARIAAAVATAEADLEKADGNLTYESYATVTALEKEAGELPAEVSERCLYLDKLDACYLAIHEYKKKIRSAAAKALDEEIGALLVQENSLARCDAIATLSGRIKAAESAVRTLCTRLTALERVEYNLPKLRKAADADARIRLLSPPTDNLGWAERVMRMDAEIRTFGADVKSQMLMLDALAQHLKAAEDIRIKEEQRAFVNKTSLILSRTDRDMAWCEAVFAAHREMQRYEKSLEKNFPRFVTDMEREHGAALARRETLLEESVAPFRKAIENPPSFRVIEDLQKRIPALEGTLTERIPDFKKKWQACLDAVVRLAAEEGVMLYGNQKYAEAVDALSYAAERAHAEAQYTLGMCYKNGYGVKKADTKNAIVWYEKAAAGDFDAAILALARLYHEAGEYKKALPYLERARKKGDHYATEMLGIYLVSGKGGKSDIAEGFRLLKSAAKSGEALLVLGECYEKGIGTTVSEAEAMGWYKRAVAAGCAAAQRAIDELNRRAAAKKKAEEDAKRATSLDVDIGKVLSMSDGIDKVRSARTLSVTLGKEPSSVLNLCRRYAEFNRFLTVCPYIEQADAIDTRLRSLEAQYSKNLTSLGFWSDQVRAVSREVDLLPDAAKGYCKERALLYRLMELVKDALNTEINACFELAKKKDPEAMYQLAMYYYRGRGVTRNYEEAVHWLEKAVKKKYIPAFEALGDCYANGHGVPISQSKADSLYIKGYKLQQKK